MQDKKIRIITETGELSQRIKEVNTGLLKWLLSQGDYDSEKDLLRLTKSEKQKETYIYHYEIQKGESILIRA